MASGNGRQPTDDESAADTNRLSRREVVALSSAGLASIAGCSQSGSTTTKTTTSSTGDGTSTDKTTQTSGTPKDVELTGFQGNIPTNFNWNFFQTSYPAGNARRLYHEIRPQATYFLENWEYDTDQNIERWTFPKNIKWWNGKQVTAEDEYVKWEISRLQNPANSSYESVNLADTYTLEFKYKEPQNPTIVQRGNALGTPVATPRWKYKSWLHKYQDASTQSERNSITKELEKWAVSSTELIEEGLGNHPYELKEVNSQEMVQELQEDHPWVKPDQVRKLRTRTIGESPSIVIKQNKIDYNGSPLPNDFRGPANLKNIVLFRSLQGSKVMFNNNSKYLKDRKVRRAMIHLLDGEFIKRNQSPGSFTVTKQTGMGDRWSKEWLGEDFYKKLHDYPFKSDPKGATKLLNEAGYSKQDGTWIDPNGEEVTLDILSGNWGAFVKGARTVNAQLQRFGFNTNFQALSWGAFTTRAWDNMKHDLTFYYQNNWINHPVSYYRPHYPGGLRLAKPDNFRAQIEGWLEEGRENSPLTGVALTPTIPSEPGALEVSGDGEKINIYKLWDNIHSAQSREETSGYLRKLARYWNYDVPHFHVYQWQSGWWGDIEGFDMPIGDEDIKLYQSSNFALRQGKIKYRYKDE